MVVDTQIIRRDLPLIESAKELEALDHPYVIFANYVYNAEELVLHHPGGARVIETVVGREVDRFLYGMYSSELMPELPAYSHSANCLDFVGEPVAKLEIPPTYEGFKEEITKVKIGYVRKIS